MGCDSKFRYLTSNDKEILKLIEKENAEKLLDFFSKQVEFDYGSEASMIFLTDSDRKDLLKGKESEFYRFIFGLDDKLKKDTNWLSLKEAIKKAYKVEGENNGSNEDKSYIHSIHIYNENAYNRINLRCTSESSCEIIYFTTASSRF
jgi:hypothetical protein